MPDDVKLTEEEFILRAIERLRKGNYKGIHVVYSGFNAAFRDYFGAEADPRAAVDRLVAKGVVVSRVARGGATIYKAAEAPAERVTGSVALDKILG